MGKQKLCQRRGRLLIHHVRPQQTVIQIRQITVDMPLFYLLCHKVFYLEPIGLIHILQLVPALCDIIVEISGMGIVHIVLIGKIFQHRLGDFPGLLQIQGHHEVFIQICDPKLGIHPCTVPFQPGRAYFCALYEQCTDFLKQLHVFSFPI